MAKPARGLPEGFSLSLPQNMPAQIGDFFEEEDQRNVELLKRLRKEEEAKPTVAGEEERRPSPPEIRARSLSMPPHRPAHAQVVSREGEGYTPKENLPDAPPAPSKVVHIRKPLRKQLNLSPQGEEMLDQLVEHVRTFSGQSDARVSEVFQAIVMLLSSAKDELDLSALPKRGACGSVTAKNFPSALAEAFERAIVRHAEKSRPG